MPSPGVMTLLSHGQHQSDKRTPALSVRGLYPMSSEDSVVPYSNLIGSPNFLGLPKMSLVPSNTSTPDTDEQDDG